MGFFKKLQFWRKRKNNTSKRDNRHYETESQMSEERRSTDRTDATKHLRGIWTNMQTLKITNSRLRRQLETTKKTEMELRNKVEEMKKWMEAQKENLEEHVRTEEGNYHEDVEQLEKELDSVKDANSKLQTQLETTMKTHQMEKEELMKHHEDVEQLEKELDAVKDANSKLQTQLETTMKTHQMEKEELMKQNEDLRNKLEAVTARASASSLQLTSSTSGPQGDLCLEETNPLNSFQPIRVLGQGAFGTVVLAKKKAPDGSQQLFAVKALTDTNLMDDADRDCVFTEKEVMILASDHHYITTLHSCFRAKGNLFFVMEYESGGSLATHLLRERVFSERTVQFYTAEITLALEFLHTHGILHRDLKPANVLIGGDGHCKVADFGLSELRLFTGQTTSGMVGTPYYMAPEMVQGIEYGQEIDWWALGIMMYMMLTGTVPFYDKQQQFLLEKIKCSEVEYPQGVSKAAEGIMRKLLVKDPTQRLGTYHWPEKVREQPFFEGIDWTALKKKRMEPPRRIEAVEETEETVTFDDLFEHDNQTAMNSQEEFEGFSYVVHRVKQG